MLREWLAVVYLRVVYAGIFGPRQIKRVLLSVRRVVPRIALGLVPTLQYLMF